MAEQCRLCLSSHGNTTGFFTALFWPSPATPRTALLKAPSFYAPNLPTPNQQLPFPSPGMSVSDLIQCRETFLHLCCGTQFLNPSFIASDVLPLVLPVHSSVAGSSCPSPCPCHPDALCPFPPCFLWLQAKPSTA